METQTSALKARFTAAQVQSWIESRFQRLFTWQSNSWAMPQAESEIAPLALNIYVKRQSTCFPMIIVNRADSEGPHIR